MKVVLNSVMTDKPVALGFRWNWNFGMLVFEERGKPVESTQRRTNNKLNPRNYDTRCWDSNPGYIDGGRALSPLLHPCSAVCV